MLYCGICYSVHFPGQCRRTAEYAAQVYAPVVSLEAYSAEPDPAELKLCRPCSDARAVLMGEKGIELSAGFLHGCDGNGCQCELCRDILPLLQQLDDEWDLIERWGL